MDIDAFPKSEKILRSREKLLAVEEDKLAGRKGVKLEELDTRLDQLVDEA